MNKGQEQITQQRREVVEKVIEDMKKGGLDWLKPWTAHYEQRNAISGTSYRGGNRIHLSFIAQVRGYEDPRWCTYRQASEKGWQVRKGAKSAKIEKWKMLSTSKERQDGTTDILTFPRLMGCWSVFNAEDIEGIPELGEPEVAHVDDGSGKTADRLIASSRCTVKELKSSNGAYYSPSLDYISIPSRELFVSNQAFCRVLLHEMTHSTGHGSALNRPASGGFGSKDYAFEELVAEMGSMFAASEIGLDADGIDAGHYERHAAYLESWLHALANDTSYLFKAASKADAAADYLAERFDALAKVRDVA